MTIITEEQKESLISAIYQSTMALTLYSESGEQVQLGMGEMGEARDEATRIVETWMESNNIEHEK